MLAKLHQKPHRAGALTAVWGEGRLGIDPADQFSPGRGAMQATRGLVRARPAAVRGPGKARQHLQGGLLRHGRIHPGQKGGSVACRRWLTTVRFQHPARAGSWSRITSMPWLMPRRGSSGGRDRSRTRCRIGRWHRRWRPYRRCAGLGMGLEPVATPCLTLHRGGDGGVGGRGRPPLRDPAAADGLSGADAVGTRHRLLHPPGRDRPGAGSGLARRVPIDGARDATRMPARVSRKLQDRIEALPKAVRDIARDKGSCGCAGALGT